jgi:hypothetical protein
VQVGRADRARAQRPGVADRGAVEAPGRDGTAKNARLVCVAGYLALNRSVHRLYQVSWSLAPEDGVGSAIEIVKQVLDLRAGVQRSVAVVFLVPVAPVQRP